MKRAIPILLAAMMIALAGGFALSGAVVQAQGNCQTFKETGKTVCGKFLTYWNEHGGLRQQGYPISNEFQEVSEIDGKEYTVQYFERAVFELHPENKPPYDVLLSLLGKVTLDQKYPGGPPASSTGANPDIGQHFPETGQYVWGEFLDYWKANGGLAQQGYPISGRFSEKSDLDGKEYTVQYFERAVFELHPENAAPNLVLLTQLGTMQFKKKYPGGEPPPGPTAPLQIGRWGSKGWTMDVRADGAFIEWGCAHANITTPILIRSGKFDVVGTYVQETGGPVLVDDNQAGRPARFYGTTNGKTLSLTVTYLDDSTTVGTYDFIFGNEGQLMKCL